MPEITSQTRIDAPPETVFDFIDHWQNAKRYLRRVTKYQLVSPDAGTGVGARFDISVQAGPTRLDGKIVVTEHERPSRIAFRNVDGVRVEGSWTIAPDGPSTRVVLHAFYEPPGGIVGRLVASFIKQNAQNDLDASLVELKRLVESGA